MYLLYLHINFRFSGNHLKTLADKTRFESCQTSIIIVVFESPSYPMVRVKQIAYYSSSPASVFHPVPLRLPPCTCFPRSRKYIERLPSYLTHHTWAAVGIRPQTPSYWNHTDLLGPSHCLHRPSFSHGHLTSVWVIQISICVLVTEDHIRSGSPYPITPNYLLSPLNRKVYCVPFGTRKIMRIRWGSICTSTTHL